MELGRQDGLKEERPSQSRLTDAVRWPPSQIAQETSKFILTKGKPTLQFCPTMS
jgi:hypothetical protein